MIDVLIRSLRHRPGRTVTSVLAISVSIALVLLFEGFRAGLYQSVRTVPESLPATFVAMQAGVSNVLGARSVLPSSARAEIEAIPGVRVAHPLGGAPIIYAKGDVRSPVYVLAYDTAGARRLLDERGWTDQDGDGVREKDGKPLRFTLLTNAGNARRNDVTQIVQQQWKRVGVDARLRQMETPTFLRSVYEKKFEAALGSWGVALSPDISQSFRTGGPFNVVSYASPEVDRMMDQALAQPTAEKADPLWRAAAERIVQDQPYTWLYFYDPLTAVSGRLRGVRVDSYGAYQNLWEWWIPRQMRGGEGQPAGEQDDGGGAGHFFSSLASFATTTSSLYSSNTAS